MTHRPNGRGTDAVRTGDGIRTRSVHHPSLARARHFTSLHFTSLHFTSLHFKARHVTTRLTNFRPGHDSPAVTREAPARS